ncbi:hypothetical protein SprV_0301193900 [Sparganum proliferum]
MSGVKNALNELKSKQESLQAQLDERDAEIKKAQSENYELEQNKLSLERQVLLMQQKIKSIQLLVEQKESKIKELQALSTNSESSESLSLKSQDVDARRDELLNHLKDARDEANRMDMQYEEVAKRLINMQRNGELTLQRAIKKEERAAKLEEAFEAANSKFKNLSSKESEDTTLPDEISELQVKLQEATRKAEISEMEIAGVEQSIKTVGAALTKQKEENAKIRKEMEAMHIELGA